MLIFAIGALVIGLFTAFTYDVFGSAGMGVVLLLMFLLEWLYGVIFETFWKLFPSSCASMILGAFGVRC